MSIKNVRDEVFKRFDWREVLNIVKICSATIISLNFLFSVLKIDFNQSLLQSLLLSLNTFASTALIILMVIIVITINQMIKNVEREDKEKTKRLKIKKDSFLASFVIQIILLLFINAFSYFVADTLNFNLYAGLDINTLTIINIGFSSNAGFISALIITMFFCIHLSLLLLEHYGKKSIKVK